MTIGVHGYLYYDMSFVIRVKITNCSRFGSSEGKNLNIMAGQGFAQGVFLPFGITTDDEAYAVRNGGMGSTG